MASHALIKQWSIVATARSGGLSFSKAGQEIVSTGDPKLALSPVEYLLLAAAGCLALSIQAAIIGRKRTFSWVRVLAAGEKAADLPSRLHRLELRVAFGEIFEAPEAAVILEEAKRLCTVTNTLGAAPIVDIFLEAANP
jgi:uncharacterized OsmC-like protein